MASSKVAEEEMTNESKQDHLYPATSSRRERKHEGGLYSKSTKCYPGRNKISRLGRNIWSKCFVLFFGFVFLFLSFFFLINASCFFGETLPRERVFHADN